MPWYCYRCPSCDKRWASEQPEPDREWCSCNDYSDTFPLRDYRAERANVNIANLRKDRESK